MSDALHELYEQPATPVQSGFQRARRQIQLLESVVDGVDAPVRVVDIGCGDGTWTAAARSALKARGTASNVIGLDWSQGALARARDHGLPVARATVEGPGLPLASHSVDVVIMSEFIEHLVDTDAALGEAKRVLVPGGHLLLSTPNLAAWFNRGLLLFGVQPVFSEVSIRSIYGRPGHEVVGHLHLFTKRALTDILDAHGFVDTSITGAEYHDVPRTLRPIDRLMCATPSLSSILLAVARAPG